MKKLLILVLMILCFSPLYAQRWRGLTPWKKPAVRTHVLRNKVRRAAVRPVTQTVSLPKVRVAQITNVPGKPMVNVRLPETAVSNSPVLSARILKPIELHRNISLEKSLQLYMPEAFYLPDEAAYRGMRLDEWDELKNLLINGLQVGRTHYGMIYTAKFAAAALSYAVPDHEMCVYESLLEEDEFRLTVITKIPLTSEVLSLSVPDHRTGWLTFGKDIPAFMISDVMIFLEINGKPDWYKVTLEEGNLLLTPAPSKKVPGILDSY